MLLQPGKWTNANIKRLVQNVTQTNSNHGFCAAFAQPLTGQHWGRSTTGINVSRRPPDDGSGAGGQNN